MMGLPEAAFFRECPGRRFRPVDTVGGLKRTLARYPESVRIISFCSHVIVPPDIVARYPNQCFNFHPGPPEIPGFRPSRHAAKSAIASFGVTFHAMTAQVDAGPHHTGQALPHAAWH